VKSSYVTAAARWCFLESELFDASVTAGSFSCPLTRSRPPLPFFRLRWNWRVGLRLVEVVDLAEVPAEMRSDETNLVHNLARDWSTEDLAIDYEVLHGSRPATAIVDYANRMSDVVLIAMASHGVPASTRMVVPSETFRVVRKALCPVIALHPLPGLPRSEHGVGVAGVDRLARSAEVVDFAIAEASRRGAPLLLVHIWEEQIYAGEMGVAYATIGPFDNEVAHLTRTDEVVAAAKRLNPSLR
jgi:Universal stress protein family